MKITIELTETAVEEIKSLLDKGDGIEVTDEEIESAAKRIAEQALNNI